MLLDNLTRSYQCESWAITVCFVNAGKVAIPVGTGIEKFASHLQSPASPSRLIACSPRFSKILQNSLKCLTSMTQTCRSNTDTYSTVSVPFNFIWLVVVWFTRLADFSVRQCPIPGSRWQTKYRNFESFQVDARETWITFYAAGYILNKSLLAMDIPFP
jgi:hypothetical protein